jgi:UDP-glucose 4-epimerase
MRVLVTGLGTFWGSRLAQQLEADPNVELVVGVDTREPQLPLERTEFVHADSTYGVLHRIVHATGVDTVIHTHLEVDSTRTSARRLHEVNVIGTTNLLAAAGAEGSPVRKVVLKTSTLIYGAAAADPYFFREDAHRTKGASTPVERSLVEISDLVRDFTVDNPHVVVSELRFANVLGPDVSTVFSRMLRMRAVPEVLGFDPRLQFVHQDDVTSALAFAARHRAPGTFNVAGPDVTTWSAVCRAVGRRRIAMPPVLTGPAAVPLRLARIVDIPQEVLALLRFGRGVDTTRFRQAGFEYEYDTPAAVEAFARTTRRERVVGRTPPYRYSPALENFFRHSRAVR